MDTELSCCKRIVSKTLKMKMTRTGILFSSLPSLLMLVLFYSLAVHMYQSLGGWPSSIGETGFPRLLVAHAHFTQDWFGVSLLSAVLGAPAAIFICLIIRRYHFIPYVVLYAVVFFLGWGLMQLAPKPFLNWWWD